MLDAVLGFARDAGWRMTLVGILPIGLLALLVLFLVWGGAPADAPSFDRFVDQVEGLSTAELLLLLLGLVGAAVASQPLQVPLVRLLEGYWPGAVSDFAERRRARHRKRRADLEAAQLRTGADDEKESAAERSVAAWRLQKLYPPAPLVMPTALGNALRAAEDRAGRRYGLDTVVVWPRLYPLVGERVAAILDDQRLQLDIAARWCATALVAAVVSFVLLVAHPVFLLVPAGALLLAWLAYRGAVTAAIGYGEGIETAFDLHRFDLLRALHLPLPSTSEEERALNAQLTQFLLQGRRVPFVYDHAQGGEAVEDAVPG